MLHYRTALFLIAVVIVGILTMEPQMSIVLEVEPPSIGLNIEAANQLGRVN